jgi:hypothetical protein
MSYGFCVNLILSITHLIIIIIWVPVTVLIPIISSLFLSAAIYNLIKEYNAKRNNS